MSIYYAINYHDLCAGWLTGWRARASGALWSVALRSYDVAGEAEPYPTAALSVPVHCQVPTWSCTVVYCTQYAFHRQNGVRYLALSRTIHAGLQLEGPAQSSDHGGPQRFRTGRQPHIHMLLGLGQNEACAQPGGAPPEATQAGPNQPW